MRVIIIITSKTFAINTMRTYAKLHIWMHKSTHTRAKFNNGVKAKKEMRTFLNIRSYNEEAMYVRLKLSSIRKTFTPHFIENKDQII